MRSKWLRCILALAVIAAVWGGWSVISFRADRAELEQSRAEVAAGRHQVARKRLLELIARRPSWGEAHYQLGLCEEARNQPDAALAAWSRVPSTSPFAVKAAIAGGRVLSNAGRFAAVEALLSPLPRGHDPDSTLLRQSLELLYRIQGRNREVRALILESWESASDPAGVLKRIYRLDNSKFPVHYVKQSLRNGDPQDDRVWLGRANLAIWLGQLDEARRWLDACEKERPDDPAVWSARLDLAQASQDVEAFRLALAHLPTTWFQPIEILRLRSWLAARTGDDEVERRRSRPSSKRSPGTPSPGPGWPNWP